MERLKGLDLFQKAVLLVLAVLILVFSVLYLVIRPRVGIEYGDAFLVMTRESRDTVYAGKIDGQAVSFTATPEGFITCQYGDRFYGPYTVRVDAAAKPQDGEVAAYTAGREVLRGEEVIFRGGVLTTETGCCLYDQEGNLLGNQLTYVGSAQRDPAEPSAAVILWLAAGPRVIRRGTGLAWFGGVAICLLSALSVFFADSLFRWGLSLRIQNAEAAEPTALEIMSRRAAWVLAALAALWVFIIGL